MTWLIFAIAAPFLYGISNFLDKFLIEKKIKDPLFLTIIGGTAMFLTGLLILLLRGLAPLGLISAAVLLAGGALSQVFLLPYYKAIALDDVSRISPIFQVIPVLVFIFSYFLLGETLSARQLIGFIMILAGGIIVSIEKASKGIFKMRKAFWWALLASILMSLPLVLFKFAAADINFWDAIVYNCGGIFLGTVILLFFGHDGFWGRIKRIDAQTWYILAANECIYYAGLLCATYAAYLGPVSLVAVLNGFLPGFVLIFGYILSIYFPKIIREDISKDAIALKLVSIVLMIGGLWIINN